MSSPGSFVSTGPQCQAPPAVDPSAAWVLWMLTSAALLLTYTGLALLLGDSTTGVSGWFVPDGITLFSAALDDRRADVAAIFEDYPSAAALAALNAVLVNQHPLLPAVVNILTLTLAFGAACRWSMSWPVLLLLATPYYIVATPLPSKDIVVVLMVVWAIYRFAGVGSTLRLALPLAMCGAMFFVRDGFALILATAFLAIALQERLRLAPYAVLGAFLAVSAAFWLLFESLFQDSFLYARAIGVASESEVLDVDTSSSPAGYFIRLLGNATNLAFRPVFLDTSGHLNVLSTAYWISGITLLYTLLSCLAGLNSGQRGDRRIGMVGLVTLMLMAITPYVQPRYLLPLCLTIPMFSFTSPRRFLRVFAGLVLLSLFASASYRMTDTYPPAAEPTPLLAHELQPY
jgi:hypothetical protein